MHHIGHVNVYIAGRILALAGLTLGFLTACKPYSATKASTDDVRPVGEATPHGDEWLGPRDSKAATGSHPLSLLMQKQPSIPRKALKGRHPRVFFGPEDVAALRDKAKSSQAARWQRVLAGLRVFRSEPPAPPAQARRSQNVVGLGIAESALAYVIEQDPKYLAAAKKWMDVATSYEVWGYTYNKPNVDLAAGHLLFGLGWGYDLLYNDLTEAERTKYRTKLARQAKLLYEYYEPRPGRSFAYSQNHVYIPMAGLGVASYALHGEVPDATRWAQLSRAIMGRSLDTYSADGYFYESFEYWVFAVPWLLIWTSAHEHVTGEILHDRPGFRNMHLYLAHILLPDRTHVFDFADAYTGSLTRLGKTEDLGRTHPGGRLHSNYNLLHATAGWFDDAAAQGVANALEAEGHVTWYGFLSLLWYDDEVSADPLEALPTYHHFEDHGVVFYRSDWTRNATAVAFKCGPPEGYAALERRARFPDWHLSSGHAHPDANSLIVVGRGEYLTGDSGYSGVPRTDQHNTVLVGGLGQRFKPEGHNAFEGANYRDLARMGVDVKRLDRRGLHVVGDATAAYPASVGLRKFLREVTVDGDRIVVLDELESEVSTTFTALWHADRPTEGGVEGHLEIPGARARLVVDVTSKSPLQIRTEPNWMTAPGRPGSVQKGVREARGFRARISNEQPLRSARFKTTFVIKGGGVK